MAVKTVKMIAFLLFLAVGLSNASVIDMMSGKSVEEFKKLLEKSTLATQYLQNELTVFAPSDTAMAKFKGAKDDQFILNHMGKSDSPFLDLERPFLVLVKTCRFNTRAESQ